MGDAIGKLDVHCTQKCAQCDSTCSDCAQKGIVDLPPPVSGWQEEVIKGAEWQLSPDTKQRQAQTTLQADKAPSRREPEFARPEYLHTDGIADNIPLAPPPEMRAISGSTTDEDREINGSPPFSLPVVNQTSPIIAPEPIAVAASPSTTSKPEVSLPVVGSGSPREDSPPVAPATSAVAALPMTTSPPSFATSPDLMPPGDSHRLQFDFKLGSRVGVQMIMVPDPQRSASLVIAHVEPNGAFTYTADGGPGLFAGDAIVEVNGYEGGPSELKSLLAEAVLTSGLIDVVAQPRPAEFDVTLKQTGPLKLKLGVSVAIDKNDKTSMRVRIVRSEGLVPSWNQKNGLRRICKGDWITQVNGISGNAEAMHAEIQAQASSENASLVFRIKTPPRELREDLNDDLVSTVSGRSLSSIDSTTSPRSARSGHPETPNGGFSGMLKLDSLPEGTVE